MEFKKVGKLPEAQPAVQERTTAEKFAITMIANENQWYLYDGLLKEQVPYSEIDAAYQKYVPPTRSGWNLHIERQEVDGKTYLRASTE